MVRLSFATLLVALVVMLLVVPPVVEAGYGGPATSIAFAAVLIAGAFAASADRRTRLLTVTLVVPSIAMDLLANFLPIRGIVIASMVTQDAFLAFVLFVILRTVSRRDSVTLDTILGAVSAYLLIGIFFYSVYGIVELLAPGSFLGPKLAYTNLETREVVEGGLVPLLYFSFVTLTTLGYGDVTPHGALAQHLAISEAILGQLYLTILIAWLVGNYLAGSRGEPD